MVLTIYLGIILIIMGTFLIATETWISYSPGLEGVFVLFGLSPLILEFAVRWK